MATPNPATVAISTEPCIMCKKPGPKKCSKCHLAKYCSRECQREGYKIHKQFCHLANESRPSHDHKRALFFPGENHPPRLVWLKIQKIESKEESFERFDIDSFFPDGMDRFQQIRNEIQRKYYDLGPNAADGDGEILQIYMSSDFTKNPPNQAVKKFSSNGNCGNNMTGPILVTRQVSSDEEEYLDIEMRHIRHAADCVAVYSVY